MYHKFRRNALEYNDLRKDSGCISLYFSRAWKGLFLAARGLYFLPCAAVQKSGAGAPESGLFCSKTPFKKQIRGGSPEPRQFRSTNKNARARSRYLIFAEARA